MQSVDLSALRAQLPSTSPKNAWKIVRRLALEGKGEALELAAEFAEVAEPALDNLLRLWPQALDPDGFAEHLLAPAFAAEGRTELTLRRRDSIIGLRHLTMLRTLRLDHCARA
ncbi:hypothetical protein [Nonomuraea sp. NPDC050786]|uniref:hypothetical protein n=1 Tax=Nonomuraea sp. NPDC050786 TaxID=3154840 RepID=UPI00340C66E4